MKIDISKFVGTWINAYEETTAIEKLIISEADGKICMRIFGVAGGIQPGDWGEVQAKPVVIKQGQLEAAGFHGHYKNDLFEAMLAANDNKGLLVIAAYFFLNDQSKLQDFFAREFYYLKE